MLYLSLQRRGSLEGVGSDAREAAKHKYTTDSSSTFVSLHQDPNSPSMQNNRKDSEAQAKDAGIRVLVQSTIPRTNNNTKRDFSNGCSSLEYLAWVGGLERMTKASLGPWSLTFGQVLENEGALCVGSCVIILGRFNLCRVQASHVFVSLKKEIG